MDKPQRVELSEELRKALLDRERIPEVITLKHREYRVQQPIAAGFKGAVILVTDDFSRRRALKLALREDYIDRSYLEEMERAAELESFRDLFASCEDAGPVEIEIEGMGKQEFICFVEEWIEGSTLTAYVKENAGKLPVSFFLAYLRSVSAMLNALSALELRHDDFHGSNVMVVPPVKGSLTGEWSFKAIDTGSMKRADAPLRKPKDDHRNMVDHLILIWNGIKRSRLLSIRDRRFLKEAASFIDMMLDEDSSVALVDPKRILELFDGAYSRASTSRIESKLALASPFDFISAEHIADDRLLVSIFARSCPWLEKVAGPDPCLLTGPRGCGKSTIFRWLSLKAHLHKETLELQEHLDAFPLAGFFLSCSSDLQNRLGWISNEMVARRFAGEIVHYFNLLAAREVVHTLAMICTRNDRESYWGLGPAEERSIYEFAVSAMTLETHKFRGVALLTQAREAIEQRLFETHIRMSKGLSTPNLTTSSFLGDLTEYLADNLPIFREKKLTFLLDDFSGHRLPERVQKILNRVIWERRPSHVFKLSSEKLGAELTDAAGAPIDITREMREIDCGREFLALDETDKSKALDFAIELLDNRLQGANYAGSAATLIGRSSWAHGSLAMALAKKEKWPYHGLDCISLLCSGDVSSLLFVYSKIFESGTVDRFTVKPVGKNKQHNAIVKVSRKMFESIRNTFPHGGEMYAIVGAFGNLTRNILMEGQWQKDNRPTQCPRIEIDQKAGSVVDHLTDNQKEVARELIRRALFIEMEPGLSRHGNVTTLRWNLRRIFLPTFGAALRKNDAVKRDPDWFKRFMLDPKQACDSVWKDWKKGGIQEDMLPFEELADEKGLSDEEEIAE